MATSEMPQWMETVNKKRLIRERAINKFLDTHKTRFEVCLVPLDELHTSI